MTSTIRMSTGQERAWIQTSPLSNQHPLHEMLAVPQRSTADRLNVEGTAECNEQPKALWLAVLPSKMLLLPRGGSPDFLQIEKAEPRPHFGQRPHVMLKVELSLGSCLIPFH